MPERDLFANFERMRREMDELFGDVFERGLGPRNRGGFSPGRRRLLRGRPAARRRPRRAGRHRPRRDRRWRSRDASSCIAGHRRPPDAEGRVYQQLEIDFGPFRRSIPLGAEVVADEAEGHLPRRDPADRAAAGRAAAARPRTVPIEGPRPTSRRAMIDIERRRRRGRGRRDRRRATSRARCRSCRCASPSRCPTR